MAWMFSCLLEMGRQVFSRPFIIIKKLSQFLVRPVIETKINTANSTVVYCGNVRIDWPSFLAIASIRKRTCSAYQTFTLKDWEGFSVDQ